MTRAGQPHHPRSILHLIDTGGPGGAETIFLRLVTGLDRTWSSLSVVPYEDWLSRSLREHGQTPRLLSSHRSFDLTYLWRLIQLCREERVGLIHAHLLTSAVYGSAAARVLGLPLVFTFHGAPDLLGAGRFRRVKYRLLDRPANHGVFVSRYLRDALLPELRLRWVETHVIHNGIVGGADTPDTSSDSSRPPFTAAAPVVGAIGNIRPAKDYATLIRAAALVRAPATFIVAGETGGDLFDSLVHLKEEVRLGDRFRFIGFSHDVAGLLSSFEVLVVSSTTEGFSLAIVEAMAAGVPVVATRCGGPEEIVDDGVTGLLVPPADPRALAGAIDRVLDDDGLRNRLSTNAKRSVRERFSEGAMIAAYSSLYEEVLEGSAHEGREQT